MRSATGTRRSRARCPGRCVPFAGRMSARQLRRSVAGSFQPLARSTMQRSQGLGEGEPPGRGGRHLQPLLGRADLQRALGDGDPPRTLEPGERRLLPAARGQPVGPRIGDVPRRLLAGLGEADLGEPAQPVVAAPPLHREPLLPLATVRELDLEEEPVAAVVVAAGRGGAHEGGGEDVGLHRPAPVLPSAMVAMRVPGRMVRRLGLVMALSPVSWLGPDLQSTL